MQRDSKQGLSILEVVNQQELVKHKNYLEAIDKAAGVLLRSISKIDYEHFLPVLGKASGADMVVVFLKKNSRNKKLAVPSDGQWSASGNFSPISEEVQDYFVQNIWPRWEKILTTEGFINSLIVDFPAEEHFFWNSVFIKVLLILPIVIDDRLEGFISFENCTVPQRWTLAEVEFLRTAASNLAIAIKRLEIKNELKEQRDFAQRLIETAQVIILVLDTNGNILMFNPYFEKLSGFSNKDVKGKSWFDTLLTPADRQASRDRFVKAVSGICLQGNVSSIVTKDGNVRSIEWYTNVVKDYNGRIIGMLAIGQDITERFKTEQELKKAYLDLEQSVQHRTAALQEANAQLLRTAQEKEHIQKILRETEKLAAAGKLAAQIAHEINNPLAGIKNSFLLVKDAIDKNHQYYEYVGRIEKEIDRVSNIVRQMFDLYRPDVLGAKQFCICDVIKDVVVMLKIAGQQKNVSIEINCDAKIIISLSEALLRQVIYNIVQNAMNAAFADTKVKIIASVKDGRLRISVADEGPGIDDKIKEKIFEPFFTTGLGGSQSGLGLGLSITKDIVTAMDGTVTFENLKPRGVVFNISIPLSCEPIQK